MTIAVVTPARRTAGQAETRIEGATVIFVSHPAGASKTRSRLSLTYVSKIRL